MCLYWTFFCSLSMKPFHTLLPVTQNLCMPWAAFCSSLGLWQAVNKYVYRHTNRKQVKKLAGLETWETELHKKAPYSLRVHVSWWVHTGTALVKTCSVSLHFSPHDHTMNIWTIRMTSLHLHKLMINKIPLPLSPWHPFHEHGVFPPRTHCFWVCSRACKPLYLSTPHHHL